MSVRRRWSDLPPELLAVVSGRLHEAADYVRFHAVCKPWRESLPASTALRPVFFPWIVAPPSRCDPLHLKLRCVFSKTSYRAVAPAGFSWHDWVPRADGTAAWFSAGPKPALVDPFTGDAIHVLPPFVRDGNDGGKTEWGRESSGRVLYADGTVFLYNFLHHFFSEFVLDEEELHEIVGASTCFRAAILRPGDTAWRFVDTLIDLDAEERFLRQDSFFAAYRVYDGKTLVCVDGYHTRYCWHLLPPPAGDHASQDKCDDMTWKIPEGEDVVARDWHVESSHVLESRGELLRVSVLIRRFLRRQPGPQEVSVSVHALEEEVDAEGRRTAVHWVRREGRSFADRVMFLGSQTSFAVEASRFQFHGDVSGGWVYFLQRTSYLCGQTFRKPRVFRYNLVDGKAEFMERLPLELELIDREDDEPFMWLTPQPAIAPIQVIRERMESPKAGVPSLKNSIIRMEKQPKHSIG